MGDGSEEKEKKDKKRGRDLKKTHKKTGVKRDEKEQERK